MTTAKYTVYWQPGCTSCLAAREYLGAHGIEFESINVREDPPALERLAALGVRTVPVVASGNRFVLAQDLDELGRFVGIPVERIRLAPAGLAARVVALLDCAARLTRRLPDAARVTKLPGRERTYLDLAYHLPQVVVAFLDAASGGCLSYEHFNRKPPERLRTAGDVAASIEVTARAFAQWWTANALSLPERLDTYYGPQPLDAVLERTTTHVAQHLRQLERVLGLLGGDAAGGAIPRELLDGLPLPRDVWDAEVPLS